MKIKFATHSISKLFNYLQFHNGVLSRYAAPSTGGFERIGPQGRCREASRFTWGLGSPFGKPRSNPRSAGNTRHPGVVSFGYFSLDKQSRVPRPPVREPA
ncbi:hypothetical protein, partial [Methylomonas rivi]